MKALVNGKPMDLTVKKQYYNGTETVYECVNKDGVWIAVTESAVILNVRTRIHYIGNRRIEGVTERSAVVTITAKSEAEATIAHERLLKLAFQYEAALCSNVEKEANRTYSIQEEFIVENKREFEQFKREVYNRIKEDTKRWR